MKPLVSNNSRLYLAVLLTAIVVFSFWMTSRYPDLNEKAMMGGDIGIAALGFDTLIEVRSDAGFAKRVFATTVNWIDTNKKGMAFGLVLAACIMTLLSLFSRRSFSSVFANTAMGTMIGAPLGVCVNCVAPIARGMHAAGATLETTLATMLSSPTMNIIVLTMTFTLLPFYMAASKVALTLAFILIGIPLISKFAASKNLIVACPVDAPKSAFGSWTLPAPAEIFADDGLFGAVRWLAITFGRNLWFIVKKTVPLMLAAGFLGALAVTALPWHILVRALPNVTSVTGAFLVARGRDLRRPAAGADRVRHHNRDDPPWRWPAAALCDGAAVHAGDFQHLLAEYRLDLDLAGDRDHPGGRVCRRRRRRGLCRQRLRQVGPGTPARDNLQGGGAAPQSRGCAARGPSRPAT